MPDGRYERVRPEKGEPAVRSQYAFLEKHQALLPQPAFAPRLDPFQQDSPEEPGDEDGQPKAKPKRTRRKARSK